MYQHGLLPRLIWPLTLYEIPTTAVEVLERSVNKHLEMADIWQYEPLRRKFLLRSVYDVLPSPVNLCQWNPTDNPNCRLCEKRGTLDHILSLCKVALSQGRYRWRCDTVLRELAHILELERKKKYPKGNTGITFIPFVKEGTTNMPTSNAKKQCILQQASDWAHICNFQTSSRRLSDQTSSSSQLLQSALSLWN